MFRTAGRRPSPHERGRRPTPRSTDEVRERGDAEYFVESVDPNEFMVLVQSIGASLAAGEPVPPGEYADLDE